MRRAVYAGELRDRVRWIDRFPSADHARGIEADHNADNDATYQICGVTFFRAAVDDQRHQSKGTETKHGCAEQ